MQSALRAYPLVSSSTVSQHSTIFSAYAAWLLTYPFSISSISTFLSRSSLWSSLLLFSLILSYSLNAQHLASSVALIVSLNSSTLRSLDLSPPNIFNAAASSFSILDCNDARSDMSVCTVNNALARSLNAVWTDSIIPMKKGPWTSAEDAILVDYVKKHGEGNWNAVQKNAGLYRCGKSCRLRWANHLRPNLKKGAFTAEEERLIIQLHSKMGNKWARMAAHLPGRTDNEIKNYWNTRIKRCQRAGLPIYPASVCNQSSNEDQQGSSDFNCGENLSNGLLNANGLYLPDFTCDNFIANSEALPYAQQLSAVSISNLLGQSFASKNCSFMDQVNQARMIKQSDGVLPGLSDTINGVLSSVDQFSVDSEKLKQAVGFDYLHEANSSGKIVAPFGGALNGSHAFLNGNFSASRPTNGPLKVELPSLQDTESDPNSWLKYTVAPALQPTELVDPYLQSPAATPSMKSECASPRNSGLLEELIHEAQALRSGKNQQTSVRSSCSSVGTPCNTTIVSPEFDICQEYWEEQPGPFLNDCAPFSGNSFTESTPPVMAASPDIFQLSKITPAQSTSMGSGDNAMGPKYETGDTSPHPENFRPDALFSENTADPSIFNNAIAMLLGNDLSIECKPVLGDGIVFSSSSSWSNMPHACEMSEFK